MDIFFGIVVTVGGWDSGIAIGSSVEININTNWYPGHVVDAGFGKRHMIVILNDDSLTLHKVPIQNVRNYQVPLSITPDNKLLIKAIIKAKDDSFLQCLLLRACTKLKLSLYFSDSESSDFARILTEVARGNEGHFEEDKSVKQLEKAMMLSWEQLIDGKDSNH